MMTKKRAFTILVVLLITIPALSQRSESNPYLSIPIIDLDSETNRQVIVDKEIGQYLGHPTTALLDDGKTMLAVYPKGHAMGPVIYKRSTDGGLTWSNRIPVPKSWATSKEPPTIFKTVDGSGKSRLIMFTGFYPARMAHSEDDGCTWSELDSIGDFGGFVVMSDMIALTTGKGHYMALFHDDMRYMTSDGLQKYADDRKVNKLIQYTLYKTYSFDGGLTWSEPEAIISSRDMYLCEPGIVRSPDGNTIAVLLRENRRTYNTQIIYSYDEGRNFTSPKALPNELTGDRHVLRYAPDGRLVIVFRDMSIDSIQKEVRKIAKNRNEINLSKVAKETGLGSPNVGDWVGWVGTWDDLVNARPGQYRIRFKDNIHGWDCCYPGVEVLPDGTFVTTTYGRWEEKEKNYILSVRFRLDELDKKLTKITKKK